MRETGFLNERRWLPALGTVLGLLVCAALCMVLKGYAYGEDDQNLYLPFVLHWMDPALFPHDYLFSVHFAQGSILWRLLAALGRWIPLPGMMALLWVSAHVGMVAAVYLIGRRIGGRASAWIAVLLWIPAYNVPGSGIPTHDQYLTTRTLGLLLGLWALQALLDSKVIRSCALIFVGFLVHVVSAVPVAAGAAVLLAVERRWRDLGKLVAACGAGGVLLILLSRGSGLARGALGVFSPESYDLLWRKLPDVFPQAWSAGAWLDLALCVATVGLLIAATVLSRRMDLDQKRLLFFAAGTALAATAGGAGAVFKLELPTELTMTRGVLWVLLAAQLLAAARIGEMLEAQGSRWTALAGLLCIPAWMSGIPQVQALAAASLCALALARAMEGRDDGRLAGWARGAAIAGALLIVIVEGLQLGRSPMVASLRTILSLPATVLFLGLALPAVMVRHKGRGLALALVLAAVASAVIFPTVPMVREWPLPLPPVNHLPSYRMAAEEGAVHLAYDRAVGRLEAVVPRWVPRDATVIVSPRWMGFRLKTLRSSFVTFKDRSGALFGEAFAREWLARMEAIRAYSPGSWTMDDSLDLSREELLALAERYGSINLDYLVTTRLRSSPSGQGRSVHAL